MSNETEQRFLLREIERLKQRLERLEVQEKGGIWKSWTPTVTGWASGYTCIARRSVVSKICFWEVYISGTSNSTTTKITAPFTSADIDASFNWSGACATIVDAGTTSTTGGRWAIGNNSNEIIFLKDFANTAFTASGTKTIRAQGFYEMA